MSLIEQVTAAMMSDDEDTDDQSQRLVEAYEDAPPEAKVVVDDIFIALCGWSLRSLIDDQPYAVG